MTSIKQCQANMIVCRDLEEISQRAVRHVVKLAGETILGKGAFRVALSGGSTPRSLYTLLASEPFVGQVEWEKVHFFFGDERAVLPSSEESNYRMAFDSLFSKIPVPRKNIHRIKGEEESASETYEKDLRESFGLMGDDLPRFDLILLGMGDDGHTASLFPDTAAIDVTDKMVASVYVEKLDSRRITLTAPVIQNAENIMVLVSGRDKAEALGEVLSGLFRPRLYPLQLIRHATGEVVWFVDTPAAAKFPLA